MTQGEFPSELLPGLPLVSVKCTGRDQPHETIRHIVALLRRVGEDADRSRRLQSSTNARADRIRLPYGSLPTNFRNRSIILSSASAHASVGAQ